MFTPDSTLRQAIWSPLNSPGKLSSRPFFMLMPEFGSLGDRETPHHAAAAPLEAIRSTPPPVGLVFQDALDAAPPARTPPREIGSGRSRARR